MVSADLAEGESQPEATTKWSYRMTLLFLVGPGVVLWAAVIAVCVHYL